MMLFTGLPVSLVPGTKYYYKFGDDSYGWSDEYSFKAAPTPGPTVTTRVLAVGGQWLATHEQCAQVHKAVWITIQ